jgi:Uma2 family endonuclease
MTQAVEQRIYTLEEYLDFEVHDPERHEYIDGEIIPMVGGTPNHNTIIGNFYAALNFGLKRQPYRVFVAEQRLWIPERRIYTYPDVMVVQGELQLQAGRRDTITNPLFIAEVLSDSTKAYDRDEKFKAYRTIPTFQEYLLIDQYTMHIEQFTKTNPNQWLFTEYDGEEAIVSMASFTLELQLADIYDKVNFEAEAFAAEPIDETKSETIESKIE